VIEGILFGSRARRTHTAESDADIAVVLAGARGNRYAVGSDMAGIAFDVMLDTGVLVEALPLWADELKHPETFSNPALIFNIQREGLRL
jgi:predicted nucleotidyltransferase